jgi:hypothetical protein
VTMVTEAGLFMGGGVSRTSGLPFPVGWGNELIIDVLDGKGDLILVIWKKGLSSNQAVEAGDREAEGAEELEGEDKVFGLSAESDYPTDEEAEEGDLFGEAGEIIGLEGFYLCLVEIGGIEAVLKRVSVSRRSPTTAWPGGRVRFGGRPRLA